MIVDALLGTGFRGEVREELADLIDAINGSRRTGRQRGRAKRRRRVDRHRRWGGRAGHRDGHLPRRQAGTLDQPGQERMPAARGGGDRDPSWCADAEHDRPDRRLRLWSCCPDGAPTRPSSPPGTCSWWAAPRADGRPGDGLARGHARGGRVCERVRAAESLQPILASAATPELMTRGLPEEDGALSEKGGRAGARGERERWLAGARPRPRPQRRAPAPSRAGWRRSCELPMVLDADGLNAHAGRLGELTGRVAPTVLTPHAGELGEAAGAGQRGDRARSSSPRARGRRAVRRDRRAQGRRHADRRSRRARGGQPRWQARRLRPPARGMC